MCRSHESFYMVQWTIGSVNSNKKAVAEFNKSQTKHNKHLGSENGYNALRLGIFVTWRILL